MAREWSLSFSTRDHKNNIHKGKTRCYLTFIERDIQQERARQIPGFLVDRRGSQGSILLASREPDSHLLKKGVEGAQIKDQTSPSWVLLGEDDEWWWRRWWGWESGDRNESGQVPWFGGSVKAGLRCVNAVNHPHRGGGQRKEREGQERGRRGRGETGRRRRRRRGGGGGTKRLRRQSVCHTDHQLCAPTIFQLQPRHRLLSRVEPVFIRASSNTKNFHNFIRSHLLFFSFLNHPLHQIPEWCQRGGQTEDWSRHMMKSFRLFWTAS